MKSVVLRVADARLVAWRSDGRGISLEGWKFPGGHFDRATMALIRMNGANIQRASLDSANLVLADLTGADKAFLDIRSWATANVLGPLVVSHRDRVKPEALWEIERGSRLSGADVARAMIQHGEIVGRMRQFLETHEFLVCAVNQVPPFDAAIAWPAEIEGVKMEHYVAWMKTTYWISVTFCPAISVPAGFAPGR